MNSHDIYGTASLDAGCGVYNFAILDTVPSTVTPSISTLIPPLDSATTSRSATETSKASATKPNVGNTVLGTSDAGAGIRKVSAYTLALVGCVFALFV